MNRRASRIAFDAGSLMAVAGLAAIDWRVALTVAGVLVAVEGWVGLNRRNR